MGHIKDSSLHSRVSPCLFHKPQDRPGAQTWKTLTVSSRLGHFCIALFTECGGWWHYLRVSSSVSIVPVPKGTSCFYKEVEKSHSDSEGERVDYFCLLEGALPTRELAVFQCVCVCVCVSVCVRVSVCTGRCEDQKSSLHSTSTRNYLISYQPPPLPRKTVIPAGSLKGNHFMLRQVGYG